MRAREPLSMCVWVGEIWTVTFVSLYVFLNVFVVVYVGGTLSSSSGGGSTPAVINATIHRLGQFLALWTLSFSPSHSLCRSLPVPLSLSLPPSLHLSLFQFGDLPIWIWTKPRI